jgi:hypothetical protein
MSQIPASHDASEIEPELILRDIARVLEAAIPGIKLTPRVGDPEDPLEVVDVTELSDEDAARARAGQRVRALGISVDFNDEPWRGGDQMSSDVSPERWVQLAEQVLSDIQDTISQATTIPWPEVRVDGRRTCAGFGASLHGRFLHMWFGDKDEPVLKFDPVEILKSGTEDAG